MIQGVDSRSHDHQPSRASFSHQAAAIHGRSQSAGGWLQTGASRSTRSSGRPDHAWLRSHRCQSVAFTVDTSSNLEVILSKHLPAVDASKAARMELLVGGRATPVAGRCCRLEILPFNTAVTSGAKRTVRFVVVMLAVRLIVDDVEVGSSEWLRTGAASKALLVPTTGQATVCGFDRLSLDGLIATATDRPDTRCCWATNRWRTGRVRSRWWERRWDPLLGSLVAG